MSTPTVIPLYECREELSIEYLTKTFEKDLEEAMRRFGNKRYRRKAVQYADSLLALEELEKLEKKFPKLDRLEIVKLYYKEKEDEDTT